MRNILVKASTVAWCVAGLFVGADQARAGQIATYVWLHEQFGYHK